MQRIFSVLLLLLLCTGCAEETIAEPEPSWEEYRQSQLQQTPEESTVEYPAEFALAYQKDHTLDPITCGEGLQQDVASLLYEPLLQPDRHFDPRPLLCESWSVDDSGLIYTLSIRAGVLFSDGTELTAGDAASALRRAATSEKYGYRLRHVSAVAVNREGQVVITLSAPNSGFPALLDIPVVKQGTEGQRVPIGTGPYVFVTGSGGSQLHANPDWWQDQPLPVSSISLVHAKDLDTAVHLLSSRRVSLLRLDPTGDQVSATGPLQEAVLPTARMQFIGFNTASGVFSDAAARRTFSLGLRRDMLVDAFLSGHGQAAYFPIAPGSSLYPDDLEPGYSYEKAQAALSATGDSAAPTELTLLVNQEDPFRLAGAGYIAGELSRGGWRITVRALPWEEYTAALAAGAFDLYYGEIRLTADWDLRDLIGTGGSLNYGGYTDPATDALLQALAAARTRDHAARLLCTHLLEAVPVAPVCFRSDVILTHAGVVDPGPIGPGGPFSAFPQWTIRLQE